MTVVESDLLREQAYVDGRWADADSGETFPVVNPSTGETIANVPRMGAAETGRAIEAAERALPAWRSRTAKERAVVVERHVADALERGAEVVVGGEGLSGQFYAPSVLVGVTMEMAMSCEETFGPVAGAAWRPPMAKVQPLIHTQQNRILVPTSFSPIR